MWAGKNESDAYGAEEMNYWVKWLGSLEFFLEEPKIIFCGTSNSPFYNTEESL